MTEADNNSPSQRRRFTATTNKKKTGDVSSILKAGLGAGLLLLSPLLLSSAGARGDLQTASLRDATGQDAEDSSRIVLPAVLSPADVDRYRRIFKLQDDGRWAQADRLIGTLESRLLLGHVRAQRYLHPRYRSKYQELAAWLAEHADHPDAKRIHGLALRRKPPQAAAPTAAQGGAAPPPAGLRGTAIEPPAPLWGPAIEAFRQKRYAAAARQFEAITKSPKASPWVISAGAFWAARAHLMNAQPQRVTPLLYTAAQHPLTFYGLLAREALGFEPRLEMRDPPLQNDDAQTLLAQPAGARAVALLQVEQSLRAEQELAAIKLPSSAALARAIVALANHANMPVLSLRIGNRPIGLERAERTAAIYPIPGWQPHGGYNVDRALVYAIIRRESSFNTGALNASGASGLMQLMPATAKAMAGGPLRDATLNQPETNISLGQRYLRSLLADATVAGNLILLAAAYNAGPGNTAKWQRQSDDDPLLFIETLPSRETRNFITTVLTDFWVYRIRLGQQTTSLAALASGRWPMYRAQDNRDTTVAEQQDRDAQNAGN